MDRQTAPGALLFARLTCALLALGVIAPAYAAGDTTAQTGDAAPTGHAQTRIKTPPGASLESARDKDGDARVVASLLADVTTARPGDTLRVGVLFDMDEHWHMYWRNPGQAGMTTSVRLSAAAGPANAPADATPLWSLKLPAPEWPAPRHFKDPSGQITTYGYEEQLLMASSLTLPDTLPPNADTLTLTAKFSFLTCKIECIPGSGTLTRTIPLQPTTSADAKPAPAHTSLFDRWHALVPRTTRDGFTTTARFSQDRARPGDTIQAVLDVTTPPGVELAFPQDEGAGDEGPRGAFIPDSHDAVVWSVAQIAALPGGAQGVRVWLRGEVDPAASVAPELRGVLRLHTPARGATPSVIAHMEVMYSMPLANKGAEIRAVRLPLAVGFAGDSTRAQAAAAGGAAPAAPPVEEPIGVLWAMLLAFLGGMILNLMPCVLPVLSLKIGRLAELAHEERSVLHRHSAAYTGGILGAMSVLALAVLSLRGLGHQVGWGFQFQSPLFLLGLTALLVAFAANLFGVFEIMMPGGRLIGRLTDAADEEGTGAQQSFFEGILCVLLSTPCSAPLLGTAMGFALAAPAPVTLLLFAALGLGLAAPFVLVSSIPAWRGLLPRPGPWLTSMKQLMGFALLATACWLLWLVGQVGGVDAMTRALVFALGVGVASWLYGTTQLSSARRRWAARLVAALLLGASGWWAATASFTQDTARETGQTRSGAHASWQWAPFSEEAVRDGLASGRPVFVDFTADWCITCKVNERGVLASDEVAAAVKQHNVLMLRADWTRRDERIRRILARHKKAGVPMYLFYTPAHPDRPLVLPELLTTSIVLDAWRTAAR